MEEKKLPRGIRNMNPFNICKGPRFIGLRANQTDGRFCQFISMKHGCRAMWKLLESYRLRFLYEKKPFTLRNVIHRFAPPTENNTDAYTLRVSKHTGLDADEPLPRPEDNGSTFFPILIAMASVETGWDVNRIKQELGKAIEEGFYMAYPGGVV